MFLRSLLFADFLDPVNSQVVEIRSQRRPLRFFGIISPSGLFGALVSCYHSISGFSQPEEKKQQPGKLRCDDFCRAIFWTTARGYSISPQLLQNRLKINT
ncbi:hypothetical protein [Paenibacillus macerans]|uniref:hypothetical protein n=1 Tax=Paenibacillus macerans TaxID=44252 RepID=UPI003D322A69